MTSTSNDAAIADEHDERFDRQSPKTIRLVAPPPPGTNSYAEIEMRSGDLVCTYGLVGHAWVASDIGPPPTGPEQ